MIETPLLLGPEGSMLGILSRPPSARRPDFALLMFNAGVLSRIGPHRMNVKLARAFAARGVISLRFDLSLQGDSRSDSGSGSRPTTAADDIVAAMDHLQRHFGITRYAVLGICSGAVNALSAAIADPRIVGLMMFDGHWYRSRWTIPVRHWKRLRSMSFRELGGALRRRLRRVKAPVAAASPGLFEAPLVPANPPPEVFARWLQSLADRGVAIHFVYSGTVLDYYSYASQFRHTFGKEPFFASVRCDFRPEIDHTFVSLESQRQVIELVGDWIDTAEQRPDPRAAQ